MENRTLLLLVAMMFLVACAPGANDMVDTLSSEGEIAGFWLGLWHGMIAFFTFIISLFDDSVSIYEVHNNGAWYNFGFALGVGAFSSGSSSVSIHSRRSK